MLENHHAKETFLLLRDPAANILDPLSTRLSQAQVRTLRKRIILAILSTDMSAHYATCKRLDALAMERQSALGSAAGVGGAAGGGGATGAGGGGGGGHTDKSLLSERDEDRQFVLDLLVHGADLSGQIYPLPVAKQWEARVTNEFKLQAQLEETLGLPVAPFMMNLDQGVVRWKAHLGFLDYVMQPLWRGLADLFPELKLCVDTLQTNRKYYADILEEETAKAAAAAKCTDPDGQVAPADAPTGSKSSSRTASASSKADTPLPCTSTTSAPGVSNLPAPISLPNEIKIVSSVQAYGSDNDSSADDDSDEELEVVLEAQLTQQQRRQQPSP